MDQAEEQRQQQPEKEESVATGNNVSHACVYGTVREIIRLQDSTFELTDELTDEFERIIGVNHTGQHGLTKTEVERLFEFLINRGWNYHLKPNIYTGDMVGPRAIALSVNKKPGIYFIGTIDTLRRAHCCVLHVVEKHMSFQATVYENGASTGLGNYPSAAQILWVRECVPTVGRVSIDQPRTTESETMPERGVKRTQSSKNNRIRFKRSRIVREVNALAAQATALVAYLAGCDEDSNTESEEVEL